ncbi:MAG: hypothetical protein ABIQ11_03350 [Saprospiraceae bacterium]
MPFDKGTCCEEIDMVKIRKDGAMDSIMDSLMRKAARKFPYADMDNLKKEEMKGK